ncbi:MAG: isochorismatase family protein [Verrucomicrobia bacterium]|nr:isochorismatase family protein [Verrucomicrobiota bacterium]
MSSKPLLVAADGAKHTRVMPRVPGRFQLKMRQCRKPVPAGFAYEPMYSDVQWEVAETAIVVCDMWIEHPCKMAAQRVAALAPLLNRVISAARDHGALIIHAPSEGPKYYEATPFRRRVTSAPRLEPHVPIRSRTECDPAREPNLPVVTNNRVDKPPGPSGCDDPIVQSRGSPDRHQHPALQMTGYDAVSDSGQEMFNLFGQEGIKNVVLTGVHTNMCVLGRSFGIRTWVYLGFNVALCRDMTDALYDPRDYPFVSHARGTELIVEHIEKYWCPSILSASLCQVAPGSNDPATSASRS